VIIDSLADRFSSHPGASINCNTSRHGPGDITRVTPHQRWDADAPLPGLVSQKPGSRFGRCAGHTLLCDVLCQTMNCTAAKPCIVAACN
jgi:hypothetical protein